MTSFLGPKFLRVQFLLVFLSLLIGNGVSKLCPRGSYLQQNQGSPDSSGTTEIQSTDFNCPRPSDPRDYSECCTNMDGKCCPPARYFYEIDNTLATAIAVSVTLTCCVITAIIVICCFWSKCPLYSACRVHYDPEWEIFYGKEADSVNTNVMPAESPDKKNTFICPKQTLNDKSKSPVRVVLCRTVDTDTIGTKEGSAV